MEINIQIASILGEEKKVLTKLEQILLCSGCTENDIMDIKTAVAEACLNAIEHGNRLIPERIVDIHIQIMEDRVIIEVCDQGEGAKLQSLSCNDETNAEELRGWGLLFIDRLVDAWGYFYKPENNQFCVRMQKNFRKVGR